MITRDYIEMPMRQTHITYFHSNLHQFSFIVTKKIKQWNEPFILFIFKILNSIKNKYNLLLNKYHIYL